MTDEEFIRKCKNSALGSWAGYIYQGICAAIESVQILIDNENFEGFLSLDAYDDFAILNKDEKIISFHQCKDIKNVSDYSDAFELMKYGKKFYQNKATQDVKLYFHCSKNINVTDADGIELYQFPDQNHFCQPGSLFENLSTGIRNFYIKNGVTHQDCEINAAKLAEMIEKKVLEVQQKYFDSSNALNEIAKVESRISISSIKNILIDCESISITKESFPAFTKQHFLSNLVKRVEQGNQSFISAGWQYPINEIRDILKNIGNLDDKSWVSFLIQISPDINVSIKELLSTASKDRSSNLCNLIEKIVDLTCINEKIRYSHPGKQEVALTALNSSATPMNAICQDIYENRHNLNCIYEMRWLAGIFSSKIDNIEDAVRPFTQIESTEDRSIFNPQKTGLLPVQDLNNGNY